LAKFKDLTGQVFGCWVVLERANNKNKETIWLCECICGTRKEVSAGSLVFGSSTNCGCQRAENLIGQKFGKLTVIKRVENYKWGSAQWLCNCDCGNEFIVNSGSLKYGTTKSCGCLHREILKKYNTYDLSGEYGIGYTTKGEEFYFDLEDYDLIKDYCWYKNIGGYIVNQEDKKITYMHRLVMNCPDDMEIDHEFHDEWDNRKEFLRIVTTSQNQMNRSLQSNNTSGVTGVYWSESCEKWRAQIKINQKQIYLGVFDNFDEAVEVRRQAELDYFGEYRYIKTK